jgi:hypothetical protein
MHPFSAKDLFNLFCLLSPGQRIGFFKCVSRICSAKEPVILVRCLSRPERKKFSDLVVSKLVKEILPLLVHRAHILIEENPQLKFERELDGSFRGYVEQSAPERLAPWNGSSSSPSGIAGPTPISSAKTSNCLTCANRIRRSGHSASLPRSMK